MLSLCIWFEQNVFLAVKLCYTISYIAICFYIVINSMLSFCFFVENFRRVFTVG